MTAADRETQVLGALTSLVDTLLDDFDVIELLTHLAEQCTRLLAISSACVLVADPGRRLHLVAATSDRRQDVELYELQSEEGPCLDSFVTGVPVDVADLREVTGHWHRFGATARPLGVVSAHAVPLRAAGEIVGALGLFATTGGGLSGADAALASTLAHIATVAIVQEPSPSAVVLPRLQRALASRVVVEQAKGFLRERLDVSIPEASVLLRRYAAAHGRHLTEVARSLISDPDSRGPILAELAAPPDTAS